MSDNSASRSNQVSTFNYDSAMDESSGERNNFFSKGAGNLADRKVAGLEEEIPMKVSKGTRNWMKRRSNNVEDEFKKRKTANKSSLREHLKATAVEACRENDDLKAENQLLAKETEELKFENEQLKSENDSLRCQLLHLCDTDYHKKPWKAKTRSSVETGDNAAASQSEFQSQKRFADALKQLLKLHTEAGDVIEDQECSKAAQSAGAFKAAPMANSETEEVLANLQENESPRTKVDLNDAPMDFHETGDTLQELISPLEHQYLESSAQQQQLPVLHTVDKVLSRQTTGATSDNTVSTSASDKTGSNESSQPSLDSGQSAALQLSLLKSMEQQQHLSPEQLAQLIRALNLS